MTKVYNYVELGEDEDDFYSNDDLYNIDSWGADLSFRELITMYGEDELIKPELQRNYVWDKAEASRFIESLLLGLPVPSIFLSIRPNETKLIIDGYQRIMTVYDYVKGVFSKDNKIFKLSNSERINKRWRGKAFSELNDSDQRKIKSTTIHAIIFRQKEPKNDDTSLYQIFERINTGGRTLTPQEIRNCIYQGEFNSLLTELNKNLSWRTLYGVKTEDTRMKDIEFILRFLALCQANILNSQVSSISLKKTLNEFMGSEESSKKEILEERRADFEKTMDFILEHIGDEAFFNVSNKGKVIQKLHPTVYDAIAVATYLFLKSGTKELPRNLKRRREKLLEDEDFRRYTTIRTTNIENIKGRINKAFEYLYHASD